MIISALPAWVISLLVNQIFGFVVRQLKKWGTDIDWELVKTDFGERLATLTAWAWDDEILKIFISKLVDLISGLLKDAELLNEVLTLALQENFAGAIEKLKQIVWDHLKFEGEDAPSKSDEKISEAVDNIGNKWEVVQGDVYKSGV
jgi:hypothetical protein